MSNRANLYGVAAGGALVLSMLFSLSLGRYPVPIRDVLHTILSNSPFNAVHEYTDKSWVVVEIVRLPRILEVTLCGMGLALAGAAMQGAFRNPLVGPEICGSESAAAFGGVLAILLDWTVWGTVGSAFAFGLFALVIAFSLARLAGRGGVLALILSGVIVGSFFAAAVGMAEYVADPHSKLPAITYWLLGSFAGATYEKVTVIAAVMLVAGSILMALRWRINLLSLGRQNDGGSRTHEAPACFNVSGRIVSAGHG